MLRIHSVILELITQVAPLAREIERHDSDLAKQLRRALSSAALNVSEASDQRGKRRGFQYSIALGSARESWSALVTAAAWGYVPAPDAAVKARFDHVIGTLHRVVHPRVA
jgi:four helix bundle protein